MKSVSVYLFFKFTKDEKTLSQRYVVVKGRKNFTALSTNVGYSFCIWIQKSGRLVLENSDYRPECQLNSAFSFREKFGGNISLTCQKGLFIQSSQIRSSVK